MSIPELESFAKYAVLIKEIGDLAHESDNLLFSEFYKLIVFLRTWGVAFANYLKFFGIENMGCHVLANAFGIIKGGIEPFSSIHHEQGVFLVCIFVFSENLVIVDIGHLSCQFTYRKLAVPVQIVESRLVLPLSHIILEKSTNIVDLIFC